MAITFTDGGARVTFDSTLEFVLWALVLPLVVGACTGCLVTVVYPALADLFIHAVVATGRLVKALLVVPAALGWA
ncbi:unnamed protein product [Miscanthus lutarioriparius]|uniref:Uncharacterized protein n=1 Tax=Miscanthus lutarioriparius TaxID=422564 RepID=A0A811PVT2_9POAL|nr:unnamed protein product [Miscanthus lutarioriparius]